MSPRSSACSVDTLSIAEVVIGYLQLIRRMKVANQQVAAIAHQTIDFGNRAQQALTVDPVKNEVDDHQIERLAGAAPQSQCRV